MLISIRNKTRGWVAWLVVVIITIPFALFGVSSYFEGANQVTIAKVNGEKINAQAFENAMEQRRRFFRSQLGNTFDPAVVDNPQFRLQIVEGLVANQLIQDYAQDNGMQLSDDALLESIVSTPEFQQDGVFDQDTYRRLISARGFSTEGYEQQLRVSGGIDQLSTGLAETAVVNPREVDQLLALTLQQRDAEYTLIVAADLLDNIAVSDDEKRKEYDDNEDLYRQVDRQKLDYVSLTLDDIVKDIELDDEEISQAYEQSKGQYTKPEARIASHILLGVPRSANDAKQAEVLAQAENLLGRINAGEDFSELAKEFSEDPGSKRNGGDLGIIAKGQMAPEFEAAVYEMGEGDISAPVKTEFGYHIIKLTSLEEESEQALDDVRDKVIAAEKNRLARNQFAETAETFRTLVFEEPDSLDGAAQALGLEVKTSDWVTRDNGANEFTNPRVRAAAFDVAVLEDALNSEVIEVSDGVLIAMRKNEFESEHTKSFEDVAAQIETTVKERKAAELAQANGESLIEELKQGAPADEVSFVKLPAMKADASSLVERQIASEVFRQKLAVDDTLISGFSLTNGDYAVYRLNSITPGDATAATEEQRDQIVQQLESRDGNSAYRLFRQALRNDAKVEIFSSLLEDDSDILAAQ